MSGQDLRLTDVGGYFDLVIDDSDFKPDEGLLTAIEVSLLTDARSQNVVNRDARRGYVGDILTADIGRSLGSTLWEFDQSKLTPQIMNRIRVAAQNALQWMVEDGIARSVTATATNPSLGAVDVRVNILTNEGRYQQYGVLWRQTNDRN